MRSLRTAHAGERLRQARFCYDHLAGALGVQLSDALVRDRTLDYHGSDFILTERGSTRLERFGVDIAALRRQRRSFARGCLDWSERRAHLAGALSAGLARHLVDLDWIRRQPGNRAVHLTPAGGRGLADTFGVPADSHTTQSPLAGCAASRS